MTDRRTWPRRLRAALRPAALAIPAALVVTLTAGSILLIRDNEQHNDTAAARRDAPAAAHDTITAMLSYSADTVDKDLTAAESGFTGQFRDDYRKLVDSEVIPMARQKGVSTKARVVNVGVLTATADHATLLMFVDQVTVSTDTPTPSTSSSRITVDVVKDHGRWLVSGINPL